jgi:Ca2+-binding EF-hand superfamily protein
MAKKNDYIRVDDVGDAFRHAGQNPNDDTIKDMIDKAKKLKIANHVPEYDGSYFE